MPLQITTQFSQIHTHPETQNISYTKIVKRHDPDLVTDPTASAQPTAPHLGIEGIKPDANCGHLEERGLIMKNDHATLDAVFGTMAEQIRSNALWDAPSA